MQRIVGMVVLVAVLLSSTVAMDGASPPHAEAWSTQSVTVSMAENRYWPDFIVVRAGTTVTWLNEDYALGETHDVIAEDGSFASDVFGAGRSVAFTLWNPGQYAYYCSLHEGMYGTVVVE